MKNLRIYIILLSCLCWMGTQAQVTHVTTGTQNVTEGVDFSDGDLFFDSGGAAGDYSSGEDGSTVFCPATAGDPVTLTFNTYASESNGAGCFDAIDISDANGPQLTNGCPGSGFTAPASFTSTAADGCLTATFNSDGVVTQAGWEATITVTSAAPPLTVPTLGEWGLIIFSLLMLNLAILFMVRRRRESKAALA